MGSHHLNLFSTSACLPVGRFLLCATTPPQKLCCISPPLAGEAGRGPQRGFAKWLSSCLLSCVGKKVECSFHIFFYIRLFYYPLRKHLDRCAACYRILK